MAADDERTITALTRAELVAVLARHRSWLEPLTRPRRTPGGGEWFVRVRARVPGLMPAPVASRGLRGRTRLSLAAAVVVLVLGVLGALGALVFFLVGHWRLLVGVVVVVGVLAVLFAGNGKSRSGPA